MGLENNNAKDESGESCYLTVCSSDKAFMCRLIDWLDNQDVLKDSTVIRLHDMDPYEEVDLLRAQIEGMTVRIHDLESTTKFGRN